MLTPSYGITVSLFEQPYCAGNNNLDSMASGLPVWSNNGIQGELRRSVWESLWYRNITLQLHLNKSCRFIISALYWLSAVAQKPFTVMGVDQCSSAQLLNELFEKGKESSAALVPNPRKIPPWWAESVMEQVEWTLWIQSIMAIMNAYITHSPPCVRSILRPVVNPETSNVLNAIFRMTKCLLSLSVVKCLAMHKRLFRWPRWNDHVLSEGESFQQNSELYFNERSWRRTNATVSVTRDRMVDKRWWINWNRD